MCRAYALLFGVCLAGPECELPLDLPGHLLLPQGLTRLVDHLDQVLLGHLLLEAAVEALLLVEGLRLPLEPEELLLLEETLQGTVTLVLDQGQGS